MRFLFGFWDFVHVLKFLAFFEVVYRFVGAIVEDVRTVFERKNDATVYIPNFSYCIEHA